MTSPGLNYTGSVRSVLGVGWGSEVQVVVGRREERGDMQELSGDMMTAGDSWGVTGDILPSSRWGAATQPQPVTGLDWLQQPSLRSVMCIITSVTSLMK